MIYKISSGSESKRRRFLTTKKASKIYRDERKIKEKKKEKLKLSEETRQVKIETFPSSFVFN